MFGKSALHARKLVAIACALFLVACAGTGPTRSLTLADLEEVKPGMTEEQVQQKLGPWQNKQKDKDGNTLLRYMYESGGPYRGVLWVTINPSTGKVIETGSYTY
jgi:hypothetical protein